MGYQHSIPSSTESNEPSRKWSAVISGLRRGLRTLDPSYTPFGPSKNKRAYGKLSFKLVPQSKPAKNPATAAYKAFLGKFPEYKLTSILDDLREEDFSRLDRKGETYVDYMGGSVYPESLVRTYAAFLCNNVLGNTHSVSNSSTLSSTCADEARAAVLSFFQAPPEYTVIFTNNATGALKLVGESYPFTNESTYVLCEDSHNSVQGIREFARRAGAKVCDIESTQHGGFVEPMAKVVLMDNQPKSREDSPSLFVLTGQSNISNTKNPLSIIEFASSLGYHTVLDAAALAPSSTICVADHPQLDAMVVSFYKMFGFPTGVGALIVKKSFLAQLKRPWFGGGTVAVVQAPGHLVTRSHIIHEQFEDGTINYLNLRAITDGLRFFSVYLPFLPLRLSPLLHLLTSSLSQLRHDKSGSPAIRILSRLPEKRLKSVGEQADTGFTVSLLFLSPSGEIIPNTFIEYAATTKSISLRTGCMCNPGGSAALLGVQHGMKELFPGATMDDFQQSVGQELGVVRISLGLASSFGDVWKTIQFFATMANETSRQILWDRWMADPNRRRQVGC